MNDEPAELLSEPTLLSAEPQLFVSDVRASCEFYTKKLGFMEFGIIYDGGGSKEESDEVWTGEAKQRYRMVESNPSMIPDHAIIQTWARWPKKMLPEDQPGTLTRIWFSNTVARAERVSKHLALCMFRASHGQLGSYLRRPK